MSGKKGEAGVCVCGGSLCWNIEVAPTTTTATTTLRYKNERHTAGRRTVRSDR